MERPTEVVKAAAPDADAKNTAERTAALENFMAVYSNDINININMHSKQFYPIVISKSRKVMGKSQQSKSQASFHRRRRSLEEKNKAQNHARCEIPL